MAEMVRKSVSELTPTPTGGLSSVTRHNIPITARLRELSAGQCEVFPISKLASIRAVVSKLRVELLEFGASFNVEVNYNTLSVIVTRMR